MDSQKNEEAALKLAWSVMLVGGIVLAAALIWQWHTRSIGNPLGSTSSALTQTSPDEARGGTEGGEEWVAGTMPALALSAGTGTVNILDQDPGVVDRQAAMLRRDAAAAEKSEVGPSSLVLTEERIQALEREKRIVQ